MIQYGYDIIYIISSYPVTTLLYRTVRTVYSYVSSICTYQYQDSSTLQYKNKNKKVLDFCCGTGISTINNNNAIGIDTSFEMLKIAKRNNKNAKFYFGNAEYYIPPHNIDIVSCMFAFYEIPLYAQKNIITNAINIAKEKVIIVDISPNYKPSKTMLTGEPYILEYLSNIQGLLDKSNFEEYEYIKGHVNIWTFCK